MSDPHGFLCKNEQRNQLLHTLSDKAKSDIGAILTFFCSQNFSRKIETFSKGLETHFNSVSISLFSTWVRLEQQGWFNNCKSYCFLFYFLFTDILLFQFQQLMPKGRPMSSGINSIMKLYTAMSKLTITPEVYFLTLTLTKYSCLRTPWR